MRSKKIYEIPKLTEYGSIADRTLGRTDDYCTQLNGGGQCPPKDSDTSCHVDKFGEYSCGS